MKNWYHFCQNNTVHCIQRYYAFFGVGESQLVTVLSDFIENQTDPTIAPYAKTGEVTLRLSTKLKTKLWQIKVRSARSAATIPKTLEGQPLADVFYGYGEDNSLARETFELLVKYDKTITAAESLTAGLFQSTLASFPGASQVFNGGFVAYSMEEKSENARPSFRGVEIAWRC